MDKTRKVTKAMEAVSAVKMQKSQELALSGRAFATVALKILNAITKDIEQTKHELVKPRQSGKYGLLLITSDKGLAGALNSAVLKKAQNFIEEKGAQNIQAIAIGRRANEFLARRKVEVLYYKENKKDKVELSDTQEIVEHILQYHIHKSTKSWHMAYMNFVSTFEQAPVMRRVLPLAESEFEELVSDIEVKKTNADNKDAKEKKYPYLQESAQEDLLEDLVPQLLNIMVHHALWESKASEHSARMVAMKSATDKAGELSADLLLKFNKARQAAITREVSEITSGVEAMK